MERIVMNTQSLQKHFPEVYRDFFARNDLVVSGCFSISWGTGGLVHRSNYIRTKSKIPLKCYIGIQKRNDNKVVFQDVISYNSAENKFKKYPYSEINAEMNKIIQEIREKLDENGNTSGYDISFLSEVTKGHGFGFSGVSGALMAFSIYLLCGKVNGDHLDEYDTFLKSEVFQEISYLSWRFDMISTYGNTSGHGAMNVFSKTDSPTYQYTEAFKPDIDGDELKNIKRYFHIIEDKFKKSHTSSYIPLDYLVIFSGLKSDNKKIETFNKGNIKKHNIYNDFIEKELFHGDNIDTNKVSFGKYNSEESIFNTITDLVSVISMKTIYLFKNMFEYGYDESIIQDFIENMNHYRYAVSLMEKQNSFIDDFLFEFSENKGSSDEKIAMLPIYGGKMGGGYLVVLKHGISRTTIEKTIGEFKGVYPNISIDYASYLDGISGDEVTVHQYITQGIFSEYVDKNKVVYKDNKGNNFLLDYSDFTNHLHEGLVFDMIENKIYFNGVKLTSKDIPSQNTTIEVITKLLDNIGEEISNKDLPVSSYTGNKNEMLGKIILPLLKFIEAKTGEKLQLVCKGSITDFFIKMGEINLNIGIIKKL